MSANNKTADNQRHQQIVAEMRRDQQQRLAGYREQALKMFPHVCGRCSREFEGKGLRELTVHHKDHNHDHNPPDGSNWELLCLYCHDHEHTRSVQEGREADGGSSVQAPSLSHSPFAALGQQLQSKDK